MLNLGKYLKNPHPGDKEELKLKVFRIKATAYLVVGIFILTHTCLLYSAIAECNIEEEYDNIDGTKDALREIVTTQT